MAVSDKLKKEISQLLKKHYPQDSPDLKMLRLNRHARGITEATQDPLLWVRLIHGNEVVKQFALAQTIGKKFLKATQDAVVKRMHVLETCCLASKDKPDLSSLGGNSGSYSKLFASTLQHKDSIVVRSIDIDLEDCNIRQVESGSNLMGVVVDLYLTPSSQWLGYVCFDAGHTRLADVFKFDSNALERPWCTHPLHIGDAVAFLVDSKSKKVQKSTMRVVEYRPDTRLDEKFIQHYFDKLSVSSDSSLPTRLLQSPAPWKHVLNEKLLYAKHYRDVLTICLSFIGTGVVELPELMSIIGRSSFIAEVPNLLKQDPRQNYDEATAEYESYHSDICAAAHLLTTCIKYAPKEAYVFADALKCLVKLSQGKVGIIQLVALALIATYVSDLPANKILPIEHCVQGNATQNPLFWVQMICSESIAEKNMHMQASAYARTGIMLNAEKVLAKRQEVLEKYSLESLEHLNMATLKSDYQTVFIKIQQLKRQTAILLEIELKISKREDENSNPAMQGVVIDIYPVSGNAIEGYIACCGNQKSAQSNCRVYEFDSSTPILRLNEGCLLPLHIGDVIAFKPASGNKVDTILEVVEYYPPALDEEFAARYFSYINPTEGMEALLRVLESPAPWRGILNKPSLYQKHYGNILAVYNACSSADTVAIPNVMKKLTHTFKGSLFIQNIPELLNQEKIEVTDQFLSNVRTAVNLLGSFVQHLGSEVKLVAKVLQYIVGMLPEVAIYQEVLSLALSLINTCLTPPTSLIPKKRPWKTIPTLLTKQEFDASMLDGQSTANEDPSLPKVKDSGSYESLDEYGRTYFTLLRADCYGELINTVVRLKTKHVDECQDIFYHATFVGLSQGCSDNVVYVFRYEAHLPLDKSQDSILTQGNLMCFSIGGRFENDLVWGTVDKTEDVFGGAVDDSGKEVLLKQGMLSVQLCSDANYHPDEEVMVLLKQSANIVAVESPAYFRAYQPVLEALKNLEFEKVHFRNDLLDPGPEVKSKPEIFSDDTKVNPQPLYKSLAPTEMTVGQLKKALLDEDEEDSRLCLDLNQREAILNALLHPMTIIQGPPGTGKTFIAVKLLHIFLSLSTLPSNKPIIIMAYKNRAIDHFIDKCLKSSVCTMQDIVRIGHMSDGYDHLQEIRLNMKIKTTMSKTSWSKHVQKLQSLNIRIQKASSNLEKRSKLTLQNSLCSMTPEWLTSLLLAPHIASKLTIPHEFEKKLKHDPQRTLNLLKEVGVMGKQDSQEREAIYTALDEAWNLWTKNLDLLLEFQSPPIQEPSCQTGSEDEDLVEDYAQLQQERRMAADDFNQQEKGGQKKSYLETNIIDLAIKKGTKIEDHHTMDVWRLSSDQRKQLILSAVVEGYSEALDNMKESLRDYNKALESYQWKKQAECLKILRRAKVVAMTTTGAAIHQQLLNQLEAPVVFVEEAAEVLESNLLACLTPHVKHLVLIGDYMQSKPKVACWKLAKEHKFNTSMFERLVNNHFPYTILTRQNRMHPNLVPLFSYHYVQQKKEAVNIKSMSRTRKYYHPPCMAQNFFWWSYTEHWEEKRGGAITNPHEAKMVVALCIWLLSQTQQSTTPTTTTVGCKISILTPYRAQLNLLREALEVKATQLTAQNLPIDSIPVFTVDEFQGHESNVIILSLVRSNKGSQIGFLKDKSRLIVATSREKCAFYIIGNAKFLEERSPVLWKEFIKKLEEGTIGDAVPVIQHGQKHNCTTPDDLETRAFLQTERQKSIPDLTKRDHSHRKYTASSSTHTSGPLPPVPQLQKTSTEPVICIGSVLQHEQTHSRTTPDQIYTARIQRQESAPNLTECDSPLKLTPASVYQRQSSVPVITEYAPAGQSIPAPRFPPLPPQPQRLASVYEDNTEKSGQEPIFGQQSEDQRRAKFRKCCLRLVNTDAVSKWKFIGRHLGLDEYVIEMIATSDNTQEAFYQMMMKWWSQEAEKATPERLKEALENVELRNVVSKVNEYSW